MGSVVINNLVPIIVYLRSIRPRNIALSIQRCDSARVADNVDSKVVSEIGPGLVISVAFDEGATEEGVRSAAKFVLNARLSGPPGQNVGNTAFQHSLHGAESVVSLCRQGQAQGMLVVPQVSLLGDRGEEEDAVYYPNWAGEGAANQLYELFLESLCDSAAELVGSLPYQGSAPLTRPYEPLDDAVDLGTSILRGFGLESSRSQGYRR